MAGVGSKPGQRLGGRKKGTPNKVTAEVSTIARKYGPKAVDKLAELAGLTRKKAAESEQARVAALKEILDRAYGKAPQALTGADGEGPIKLQIVTGVPRASDN